MLFSRKQSRLFGSQLDVEVTVVRVEQELACGLEVPERAVHDAEDQGAHGELVWR